MQDFNILSKSEIVNLLVRSFMQDFNILQKLKIFNLLARSFQELRDLLDQAQAPEITPTMSHMKILRMKTYKKRM